MNSLVAAKRFSKLFHSSNAATSSHKLILERGFRTSIFSLKGESKTFPNTNSKLVTSFKFERPSQTIPTYRIMDETGGILDDKQEPQLGKETVKKMYSTMVKLSIMDDILESVQRQGLISFYMTARGEEGTLIGTAAALEMEDTVFGQYREAGVFLWRGFTIADCINQCYSNRLDYGKGRQMPVHYGAKHINFQTISSPLATQIPQAAGSAYAQKLLGMKNCTVCFFGEGAASEGDFHAALNFAATLETPTIFFCRNNQYAISTPIEDQYRGDGIASRGAGYGIATVRVDGNDMFAVYNVTKAAREYTLKERKPVLIESMSYRIGHHSTSDDSTRYRSGAEVEKWKANHHPIPRVRNYMTKKGWWSESEEKELLQSARKEVLENLKKAEGEKKPPLDDLFTDVYDEILPHLKEQQQQLREHLAKYPEQYPLDQYHNTKI